MGDMSSNKPPSRDPDGAMMYVACSRCRKIIDVKPGNLGSISHTYCDECFKIVMREAEEFRKSRKKDS